MLVRSGCLVFAVKQQMQLAVAALQYQIVTALGAREPMQHASIVQRCRNRAPAFGHLRIRISQLLLQLLQPQPASNVGKVRPVGCSAASNHVACGAPSAAKEDAFSHFRIACKRGRRVRRVEQSQITSQSVNLGCWQ